MLAGLPAWQLATLAVHKHHQTYRDAALGQMMVDCEGLFPGSITATLATVRPTDGRELESDVLRYCFWGVVAQGVCCVLAELQIAMGQFTISHFNL